MAFTEDRYLYPFSTAWEPMPDKLPKIRRCPVCKSAPLWRHMLREYWLVCTHCGLETAPARSPQDVAFVWNKGSGHHDLVDGDLEITEKNMDAIVEEVIRRGSKAK